MSDSYYIKFSNLCLRSIDLKDSLDVCVFTIYLIYTKLFLSYCLFTNEIKKYVREQLLKL